jgi:hypothetical protein
MIAQYFLIPSTRQVQGAIGNNRRFAAIDVRCTEYSIDTLSLEKMP